MSLIHHVLYIISPLPTSLLSKLRPEWHLKCYLLQEASQLSQAGLIIGVGTQHFVPTSFNTLTILLVCLYRQSRF